MRPSPIEPSRSIAIDSWTGTSALRVEMDEVPVDWCHEEIAPTALPVTVHDGPRALSLGQRREDSGAIRDATL